MCSGTVKPKQLKSSPLGWYSSSVQYLLWYSGTHSEAQCWRHVDTHESQLVCTACCVCPRMIPQIFPPEPHLSLAGISLETKHVWHYYEIHSTCQFGQ